MIDRDKNLICPISNNKKFEKLFSLNDFPIYMGVVNKNKKYEYLDQVFRINKSSGTVQIYPRVPLKKLYFKSHGSGKIGNIWKNHHQKFFSFINKYLQNDVLEIGGGHNSISNIFNKTKKNTNVNITSFDPNGITLKNVNHKLIKDFFNSKNLKKYKVKKKFNLILHSHLFEHIYSPRNFLKLINQILDEKGHHVFSVPNIGKMIKNGYANGMNFEHPFFLDEKMLDYLLKKENFKIIKKIYFQSSHSIFYLTKKTKTKYKKNFSFYSKNKRIFKILNNKWKSDISNINKKIKSKKNVFIFGAHIFSQNLIFNKLNVGKIKYVLDNDPDKINNYLYGTDLKVKSPKILKKYKFPTVILRAGPYNSEIKKNILKFINKKTTFI